MRITSNTKRENLTVLQTYGLSFRHHLQVLTDPRTSVAQCLQALLTAELTDNDGWRLLIQLADNFGFDEAKVKFETALANEVVHLQNVRNWLSECVMDSAQV